MMTCISSLSLPIARISSPGSNAALSLISTMYVWYDLAERALRKRGEEQLADNIKVGSFMSGHSPQFQQSVCQDEFRVYVLFYVLQALPQMVQKEPNPGFVQHEVHSSQFRFRRE